jgi:hypothetical protein
MHRFTSRASRALLVFVAACGMATAARADTFLFDDDPFAGTTVLTTPGRQVVGGEPSLDYDPDADEIVVDPGVFGIDNEIRLFNGFAALMPDMPFNFVILRTLDADGDSGNGVLLNAGLAADLIAGRLSTDGAGFFVYFNSGLNLPRLVYSTNLSDPTADLKILARFTNLVGDTDSLENFRNVSVAVVPEPAAWALMILGFGAAGARLRHARRPRPA